MGLTGVHSAKPSCYIKLMPVWISIHHLYHSYQSTINYRQVWTYIYISYDNLIEEKYQYKSTLLYYVILTVIQCKHHVHVIFECFHCIISLPIA